MRKTAPTSAWPIATEGFFAHYAPRSAARSAPNAVRMVNAIAVGPLARKAASVGLQALGYRARHG